MKNVGKPEQYIKNEYDPDNSWDNSLVRTEPDTRFVFELNSGKIRTIFRAERFNYVMTQLTKDIKSKHLRQNRYGDIIITNK